MTDTSMAINAARLRAHALGMAQSDGLASEAAVHRLDDLTAVIADWVPPSIITLAHPTLTPAPGRGVVAAAGRGRGGCRVTGAHQGGGGEARVRAAALWIAHLRCHQGEARERLAAATAAAEPMDAAVTEPVGRGREAEAAVVVAPPTRAGGELRRRRGGVGRKPAALEELLGGGGRKGRAGAGGDGAAQGATQKALIGGIASMVGQLKEAASEHGKVIEGQARYAAEVGEAAGKAVTAMGDVNDRLSDQIKRSGGCWMWSMLLTVFLSFIAMVVFIKVTNWNPLGGR